MKEYPKIETLFVRDEKTFRVIKGNFKMPEYDFLKNLTWSWTEKVDGTNIRVMWTGTEVKFGGRTDNAQIPADLVTRLIQLFPIEKFVKCGYSEPMCLYGEGYGAGIQKGGGNYGTTKDFVLFDVVVGETFLCRKDIEDVAQKLEIKTVPIVIECGILEASDMVENGIISAWGNFQAEGLVGRPKVELQTKNGKRIIVKLKTKDFAGRK